MTLSALEQIKSYVDPYTGQEVFARLATGTVDDISPEDDIVMRWHGMYRQQPLEARVFMLRLKLPNGALTEPQANVISSLAERYSGGKMSLTTRQNIELHHITLADLPTIFAELQSVNLQTLGACGDQVRNVVGCPVTDVNEDELIDTMPLSNEITAAFLANPQFANLPRKFKIALSGGGCDCVPYDINDLGLIAVKNNEGEIGYVALVGGGLSVQPAYAENLGVWIHPDEVIEIITQLVQIFKEHGNRENRGKARVKHLIAANGVEWLRTELEERLKSKLTPYQQPIAQPSRHDHLGVNRQREEGLSYIGIPVPVGIITSTQLNSLANIAEQHGKGHIRFTHLQNIILTDIKESAVPAILNQLSDAGLPVSDISRHGNTAICVGKTYCVKAITHTKEIALPLLNSINDPLLGTEVSFRISGCPNGCSGHSVADIALRGSSVNTDTGSEERFDLLVGGGLSKQPAFARRIFSRLNTDELPEVITNLLLRYRTECVKDETFSDYAKRVLWPKYK